MSRLWVASLVCVCLLAHVNRAAAQAPTKEDAEMKMGDADAMRLEAAYWRDAVQLRLESAMADADKAKKSYDIWVEALGDNPSEEEQTILGDAWISINLAKLQILKVLAPWPDDGLAYANKDISWANDWLDNSAKGWYDVMDYKNCVESCGLSTMNSNWAFGQLSYCDGLLMMAEQYITDAKAALGKLTI